LVNVGDDYSQSPLHYACRRSRTINCVKLLLQRNANVNASDKQDVTPLHKACMYGHRKNGHPHLVSLLIKADESIIHLVDARGRTPLHVVRGQLEAVKLLLQNGADLTVTDKLAYVSRSADMPRCFWHLKA
ncbi:uncharacterized protein MONBRDRAFT_14695, partial [Monosiga brevicollis MX1]